MSGDASILPEEHEKSLALAAECAKLWPKMLAKGQEYGPPEGGAPAVKCIGSLNRPSIDISLPYRRKFRSQTSDLWTDAAAVVRTLKEEKESEKREPAERRSEKRKSRRRESQQKEDQSA